MPFDLLPKPPSFTDEEVREQSLGVQMVKVTNQGITYTAAQNAPSLPISVGAPVHAIIGQIYATGSLQFVALVPSTIVLSVTTYQESRRRCAQNVANRTSL